MSQKRGMKFIILHIDNHQTFPQTEPINLGGHGEACINYPKKAKFANVLWYFKKEVGEEVEFLCRWA